MSVTLIIIIVTSLVSILCFTGTLPFDSLKFSAWDVWHRKRWYQMLSYGLVHGGWGHLLFNMLTLYFFGDVVEKYFQAAFGPGNRHGRRTAVYFHNSRISAPDGE